MSRIELESVRRTYGSIVAVEDLSLSIEAGDFHAVLGPNGSGKTTLFRMILGLVSPDAGTIARPDDLGAGFQQPTFYPELTVAENLSVFTRLVDVPGAGWRERLVDELRLEAVLPRRAGALSGGFARKLDLALALLGQPSVVLLDEPLGGLDDVTRASVLSFLEEYCEAGNTVLVSTHSIEEFDPYVDRVTVLAHGSVLLDSEREALPADSPADLQQFYVEQVQRAVADEGSGK